MAMVPPRMETPRLVMRSWTPADVAPYAATIADREVMRHLGAGRRYRLKRAFADAIATVWDIEARLDVRRLKRHWVDHGWGEWAVEESDTGAFVGRVGFRYHPDFREDSSQVEIGWLLARPFWGRGYATEAGEVALQAGFERLGLERVVSVTTPANERSVAVARNLGMTEAGHTHWHGLDVMWSAIDRSEWRAAVQSRV
jgi:RimJ/RimL family protein N-acetyltransferase